MAIIVLATLAALWVAAVIWLIDEVTFDYTPDLTHRGHRNEN